MESVDHESPTPQHHSDASRPSLGFPLGTALLLIVIFSLSGFFSCCYHWDKLRSLRRSFLGADPEDPTHLDDDHVVIHSPSKPTSKSPDSEQKQLQSLPVLMPGDQVPKFIALPCPCEPMRPEKITVKVQSPTAPPPPPPLRTAPMPTVLLYNNHVARFGVYYEG